MVLDRRVLSIVLLLVAGVLTIYVFLLQATASVAQVDDPGQYEESDITGIEDDIPDDLFDVPDDHFDEVSVPEGTLPQLTPVQPLDVDQEIEQDTESGDAIPEASVYNTGDGSAVCAPVQQTPITGNQQTGQENLGIDPEDDVLFGGPELGVHPDQATSCAQEIQPVSGPLIERPWLYRFFIEAR